MGKNLGFDPADAAKRGTSKAMADTIRGELAARGMTYSDLAERTKLSRETVARRLGMRSSLTLAEVELIAEAFDMSARDLIEAAVRRMSRAGEGLHDG